MLPSTQPAPVLVRVTHPAGWTVREFASVDSTNFAAAGLPAWHAVRATTQTAGRGRFQRTWISDAGGLWLSAVVPLGSSPEQIQPLPLVAGLAVIETLGGLGLPGLRLRWPNDIMVGARKIAGILVDSFSSDLAVVGIGINLTNRPANCDAALQDTAARVADLLDPPPEPDQLTGEVLRTLRTLVGTLLTAGFSSLSPRINRHWGEPRRGRVELDGAERTGRFAGIDARGNLLLDDAQGRNVFAPHQVRLFREV